jgi:dUTP pyrophosphatase
MCDKPLGKVAHWVAGRPIGPACYAKRFGKTLRIDSKVVANNQDDLFTNGDTMSKTLKVKRVHDNAIIPKYQTAGAACFDLHAATVGGMTQIGSNVEQGFPVTCGTGLAFEIPEGYVMLVYSRSGHGFKHQVRLSNCVGVVDFDYVGEVMVQLVSDERDEDLGHVPFFVRPGDRIAQAMLIPVDQWAIEETSDLKETERGDKGFGSTGTQSDLL